jgi:putative redox protein
MDIAFPGGLAVEARFDGFSIRTDQLLVDGGQNSAPSPFKLFLASLGTCAGFYALRFCQEREIPPEGLGLTLEPERDPDTRRLSKVAITLKLPSDFPAKYRQAIVRAVDQCTVKKAILDPPEFVVETN